jgi:hypothetical protein
MSVFVARLGASGSLVYSSYLGGTQDAKGHAIAVDAAGEVFVSGQTGGDFPTVSPVQGTGGGNYDAFVTKMNASGSALVYSTYLGGAGIDIAFGIAVDAAGEAFVGGGTSSTDFPTASPLQPTNHSVPLPCNPRCPPLPADGFVAKLNATGSALVYSTYLGGAKGEAVQAIALDPAGDAFVTGWTSSTDFPTVSPYQPSPLAGPTAFVSMLNAAGSALVYSTYLDGNTGSSIAVDPAGRAVVGGSTQVAKFNPAGSALVASTALGGQVTALALGPRAQTFVVGTATSGFPTVSPYQASYGGNGDVFLAKLADALAPAPATDRFTVGLGAMLLMASGWLAARRSTGRRHGAF